MGIKLSEVSYTYNAIKKNKKKKQTNVYYSLNKASLNINNNDEFVCIVGHTGSGKSTLIQHLNLLIKPTHGLISIENDAIKYDAYGIENKNKIAYFEYDREHNLVKRDVVLKPLRKHVGLVFQFPEYQMFEETVLKDIMFGPMNFSSEKDKKIKEEKAKTEAIKIAKRMGIEGLLDQSPFELSGGQMRKVAIAGILASDPDVLVLDEPTVGLDPLAKKELLLFLKELNEKEHKSIILITHDMDVVGEYAKRVIVLNKGLIKYDGPKTELFENENVVLENNLSYPSIVVLLRNLKQKLNLNGLNEYQYNIQDAFNEIKRIKGDQNE